MAETIGGIKVRITADLAGFNAGLKKATSSIASTAKRLRDNSLQYQRWATVGAAAATAVATAMVRSQMKQIDALAKTADRLGLTTEALAGLQRSAQLTGASTETLNMALQRMTRRVAEAAQGTGEAKNAIKELGLDAKQLAALSPDQQFRKIAESMQSVTNQGDRVRLAMKLFDSEGVKLVNTLALGADGLDKQAEMAQKLGVALSRVDAAKVENANDAMFSVGQAIEGIVNRVTVQLSHVITAMANSFVDASVEADGFADTVDQVFSYAVKAVGVFADGLRGIEVIFYGLNVASKAMAVVFSQSMLAMTKFFAKFIDTAISGVNKLTSAINSIADTNIPQLKTFTDTAVSFMQDMADKSSEALTDSIQALHDKLMEPIPSQELDAWVKEVQKTAQKVAEATAGTAGAGGQQAVPGMSEAESKALADRYAALQESFMTESELLASAKEQDRQTILDYYANLLADKALNDEQILAMEEKQKSELMAINERYRQAQAALDQQAMQQKLSFASQTFNALASLMNTESKKLFEIGKAAAIAGAIVDGYAAVSKTMASVPYPFNIPLAAAQAVASAAQVQGIAKQKIGGAQAAGASQSFNGGVPVTNTQGQGQAQQRNVNIAITGDNFSGSGVRSLIKEIASEASDMGLNLTFNGA